MPIDRRQKRREQVARAVSRPAPYAASRRVESAYYRDLMHIISKYFGQLADFGSQSLNLAATMPEWLDAYAHAAARRLVTGVYVAQGRTWQEVASRSLNGQLMYRALRQELSTGPVGDRFHQLVTENASLITSLPANVAKLVTVRVAGHEQSGERAREAESSLLGHVARTRARLTARTETSKATTALTQARSEYYGLDWYIWRGSLDARERLAHRRLEGVIVRWDDPPSPEALIRLDSRLGRYHAGNAPNCRCHPEPLVDLSQVAWPAPVYYAEIIRRYTLSQFRKLSGMTTYTPVAA